MKEVEAWQMTVIHMLSMSCESDYYYSPDTLLDIQTANDLFILSYSYASAEDNPHALKFFIRDFVHSFLFFLFIFYPV